MTSRIASDTHVNVLKGNCHDFYTFYFYLVNMKYLSGCMCIINFNVSVCSGVKIYWFKVDNNGRHDKLKLRTA